MFNVSNAYKIAAMEPAQEHRLTGTIGSVFFDEENIVAGTFNIQKQSTDSNSMVLGSCYVGQLTATFTNIGIARGAWIGKVITPTFALKLANNSWESVPLGVYKIKEAVHTAEGVQVTAYDNMIKFDKKIKNKKNTLGIKSDSMWTFIDLCCTKCNVILGMTKAEIDALPNGYRQQNDIEIYGDAKADDFANDIETYRDLLFWCAQTVGCFATMDRAGQLVLKQYTQLWDETISDSVRLSGAHFEDYVTHFTGILVTDMDTNDDTYYGYDADELLVQINETSEDLTTANEALTGNLEEQADLERRHDAHEITDEQYYAEKALLKELEKIYRTNVKRLEKRLGWLEAELQDAQNDEEGAIMDLGANPFVQYKNLTKRDNTRRRILGAMDDISYTPFTASMVCGAHYDLGDVICFTGGHSDNDICCVMSWSYTHNMGTELEGFGTDSAQQQVRVKNKAEKQADRANSTASTTGHTYVAEADPDTTTGAPRSSKNGDIWVEMNEEPGPMQPGMPFVTKRDYAGWGASLPNLDNTDGSYAISFGGNNTSYEHIDVLNEDTVVISFGNALQGERTTYSVSMDVLWVRGTAEGTWMRQLGFIFANEPRAYSYAGWGETPPAGFFVDSEGDNGTAHIQFNADHGHTQHFEGEFECLSTDGKIYMTLLRSMTREEHPGDPPYGYGEFMVTHLIISREGAEPSPGEPTRYVGKQYANDNGTWREIERIAGVDTSSDAGTDGDNGLSITQTRSQLRLKPNVMRALYKADPPQQGVNFSRFCVRYTGEPDKDIAIEPFANHTFSNIKVDADNENAFKIRCGGVGGSGSYAVYKITGLVVDAPYFFNFAYNFSDNASFGNDFTKGLGLVFNTTGTISTDSWSGEADTFDEENLYYSMYRSTTKHYADFSFEATATTMYMCVVMADETGGQDITLTLNEFVIANSERKLIRNIYLYDYNKNVWLKYRPFGSVTGGSDDGGGSQVEITPTISTGTKIADYSIDGVAGELFAPQGGSGDVDAIEITYAEYQLLTPEEKADPDKIYFITDYPSGNMALDDLTDVDITTPSERQILTYDDTDDEWKNTDVDDIAPTVTEASERANLASGDSLKTIIGKIKKWFSDLKDLAFTAIDGAGSTKYLRGDGTWQAFPTIPTVGDGTITIQKNGTSVDSFTTNQSSNKSINITMSKSDVGLGNVDNTSDLNKPISNATAAAIAGSKTATGSVVTVTDAADIYAEEVQAAVAAIQDLHGYPKPWVGGAGRNKLPLTASTIKATEGGAGTWTNNAKTIEGIIYTIMTNSAGSVVGIKANGTASAESRCRLVSNLSASNMILNGCPSGGSTSSGYCIALTNSGTTIYADTGSGVSIGSESRTFYCTIIITRGTTVSNKIFYPMLRLSTEQDSTFMPYNNVCPIQGYDIVSIDTISKNRCKPISAVTTVKGITITPQSDGSVVLNGTKTTDNNAIVISSSFDVVANVTYALSATVTGGTIRDYGMQGFGTQKTVNWASNYTSEGFQVVINKNDVLNNVRVYPQIEIASSPSSFQPYGHNRVAVQLGNKNLLPMTVEGIKAANTGSAFVWSGNTCTVNGVTFTLQTDKNGCVTGIKAHGQCSNAFGFVVGQISVTGKELICNGCPSGGGGSSYYVQIQGVTSDTGSGASFTLSTQTNVLIVITSGYNCNNVLFKPMIRDAAIVDPTFSPYNPTLGDMVYGGQLTLNDDGSAVFVGDYIRKRIGDITNWTTQAGTYGRFICTCDGTTNPKIYFNKYESTCISDIYQGYADQYKPENTNGIYAGSGNLLKIWDSEYTNASDLNSWKTARANNEICYKLAEPYYIHLSAEQLKLLQGTNNVWSNAGDVTLKYQPDNVIAEPKADVQRLRDDVDDRLVGNACRNLFDENGANWKNGYFINSSGVEQYLSNYRYTQNYIEVEPNTTYSIQAQYDDPIALAITVPFYDESKTFISRATATETTGIGTFFGQFTTPENCHYIRMSVAILSSRIQLERGSSPTPYEEYYPSNRELWKMIKALQ